VPSGGAVSDIRFDNYEIGAKYLVSPVLTAGLSYVFTDGKTDYLGLRPQFHQINLGGNYLLSKQTVFYMVATYQRARGDGIVYNGSGLYVPVAATAGLSDSATGRQVTVTVGIKHSF
jgi:predicted porin